MKKKLYSLKIKIREWDGPNGEKKAKWIDLGACFEGKSGPYLLLDKHINLSGLHDDKDNVLVSMFKPDDPNFSP